MHPADVSASTCILTPKWLYADTVREQMAKQDAPTVVKHFDLPTDVLLLSCFGVLCLP